MAQESATAKFEREEEARVRGEIESYCSSRGIDYMFTAIIESVMSSQPAQPARFIVECESLT